MKKTYLHRLVDIEQVMVVVETSLAGKTVDDLKRDVLLRLAVERALQIVSEASRHIPEDVRSRYGTIAWRDIAAFGNKLRHEYDRLDYDMIWDTATRDLADLKPVIQAIKEDLLSRGSETK